MCNTTADELNAIKTYLYDHLKLTLECVCVFVFVFLVFSIFLFFHYFSIVCRLGVIRVMRFVSYFIVMNDVKACKVNANKLKSKVFSDYKICGRMKIDPKMFILLLLASDDFRRMISIEWMVSSNYFTRNLLAFWKKSFRTYKNNELESRFKAIQWKIYAKSLDRHGNCVQMGVIQPFIHFDRRWKRILIFVTLLMVDSIGLP